MFVIGIMALSLVSALQADTGGDKSAPKSDSSKRVCRRQTVTASRMSTMTCHTKAEWAILDEDAERRGQNAAFREEHRGN